MNRVKKNQTNNIQQYDNQKKEFQIPNQTKEWIILMNRWWKWSGSVNTKFNPCNAMELSFQWRDLPRLSIDKQPITGATNNDALASENFSHNSEIEGDWWSSYRHFHAILYILSLEYNPREIWWILVYIEKLKHYRSN